MFRIILLALIFMPLHTQAQESYLDKWEEKMNNAEKHHFLQERENNLIQQGILPQKTESKIRFNGIEYENYEEFRQSSAYTLIKIKKQIREIEYQEKIKKEKGKQENALKFIKMWQSMSLSAKDAYTKMPDEKRQKFKEEWENPQLKLDRYELEKNVKFYLDHPRLIPKIGINGLPNLPTNIKEELQKSVLKETFQEPR